MFVIFKVLVIVTLFGLLSFLLLNNLSVRCGGSENIMKNKIRMSKLHMMIDVYKTDCPNSEVNDNILEMLTMPETTDECFKGPYIKIKETKDTYNNTFLFIPNNSHESFVSLGKDGVFGTKDDIAVHKRN